MHALCNQVKFRISRKRREFGAPVRFSDRNVSDAKDGLIECPSYDDESYGLLKKELDKAIQVHRLILIERVIAVCTACSFTTYNLHGIRVAHKAITTLRQLLTNVKDKVEPKNRQGTVYKIKCWDCPATYVGDTGRNLNTRLTEHRRATKNGDYKNNIAEHHLQTDHRIDWDSAECISFSTDYYQRLTLESWFTNLERTPLNRCQQLPAPYKRLINNKQNNHKVDKVN